jgi:hypothetical protein
VPDVVQFDRDAHGPMLVQTYDAGATVDQWATLLPVERDGTVRANVFADCAHWWSLAHHCLRAFAEIHALGLVHLDVKGDNVCIPVGPDGFDPRVQGARLHPVFKRLALIDFAFSLASGETLASPLPIGWQREYDYQSPRLLDALEAGRRGDLKPTERLDWRCDFYSLAAMLKRYLPDDHRLHDPALACGWTFERYDAAKLLLRAIRDTHDAALPAQLPHDALLASTRDSLAAPDLAHSLSVGWRLATEVVTTQASVPATPVTPLTRVAPSIRVIVPPRDEPTMPAVIVTAPADPAQRVDPPRRPRWTLPLFFGGAALFAFAMAQLLTGLPQASEPRADATAAQADPSVPPLPTAPPPASAAAPGADETTAEAPAVAAAAQVDNAPQPVAKPATKDSASAPARAPTGRAVAATRRTADAPVKANRTARAREPAKSTPLAARAMGVRPAAKPAPLAAAPPLRAGPPARRPPVPEPEATRLAAVAPAVAATAPASPPKADPLPTAPLPKDAPPMAAPAPAAPATPTAAMPAPSQALSPAAAAPASTQPAPTGRPVAPIVDYSRQRSPAPVVGEAPPAPARTPAIVEQPRGPPAAVTAERIREDYRDRGERALATMVPKSAAQARIEIAQVLRVAADAHHPAGERAVVALARPPRIDAEAFAPELARDSIEARRLHAEARLAYGPRRDVAKSLDLELRAFGADPFDAEIAGQLALLHLRTAPVQAERARLLALHALSLRSPLPPAARADDWVTFAVASALTSRPIDATLAFYAAVAMSGSAERVCNAAVGALMIHGEPLREPVTALLARLRAQGRDDAGRGCAAPPQRFVEWRPSS